LFRPRSSRPSTLAPGAARTPRRRRPGPSHAASMGDLDRGKEVFGQRVEYPLPKKTGTKDYVFYFVPKGDGYRDAGNKFFATFYKDHVANDVRSLEDLIDVLAAEVDRGVTHIREITLLSHGNALGLLFPVLNGVTDSHLH